MDGTGIEVSGEYFEKAGTLYDGSKGFWLHNVFIGSLWVGQRLLPGGVDVARSWKSLLRETARVIGDKGPVWAFLDNAYYRNEVVAYLKALGWDFSISVTDRRKKAPIVDIVKDLPNEDWEPIKDDRTEYGLYVRYRPNNWEEKRSRVRNLMRTRHITLRVRLRTICWWPLSLSFCRNRQEATTSER